MFKHISKSKLFMGAAFISMMGAANTAFACPPGGCGSAKLICEYDASPQGFKYKVEQVFNPDGGSKGYFLTIDQVTPKYFTGINNPSISSRCPGPDDPSQVTFGQCLFGTQDTGKLNGGLFYNGTGFARDALNVGAPINGTVYIVRGIALLGPKYQGGHYSTPLGGATSAVCTQFSSVANALNNPSPNRPPNMGQVAVVNGASQLWTNHSPIAAYSGPVYGNIPPDMHLAQMMAPGLLSAYLQGAVNNDWGEYVNLRFPDMNATLATHSSAEIHAIANQYQDMGMGSAFAAVYYDNNINNFNYQMLDGGSNTTITPIAEENYELDVEFILLTKGAVLLKELVVRPQNQIGGINPYVKNIYPSDLFDPPKRASWYAGKAVKPSRGHIGYYGPLATYYNHDPLPDTCNPSSPDYIPAAFLNAEILEELRQDWRFLSLKNIADLKTKYKIEFTDKSYMSYMRGIDDGTNQQYLDIEACTLVRDGSDDDCDGSVVWDREANGQSTDHILRPVLPLQTMPADGNPNLNTVSAGKGSKKKSFFSKFTAKKKWKPKRKTNAYYDDLINNKLITMNPDWNANSCKPTYSAVAVVPAILKPNKPIVSPVKPVQKAKPIFEKKLERKRVPMKKK